MAINFPTSLDNFTNPVSGNTLDSPSHSLQHSDINDAVEALEAKLGIGASPAGSATAGYVLTAGTGGTTTWQAPATDTSAWTTFTPTWTNLTVGNGTYNYAKYKQIGKTVFFAIDFSFGTTTSVSGNPLSLTLPFNRSSVWGTGIFSCMFADTGLAAYPGAINTNSSNASLIIVRPIDTAGTYAAVSEVSSTVPFTWGSTDRIQVSGTYESV
jgi:hypothetical protein